MRIYAAQGLRRFVLCTGYLGEMIERFVASESWPEPVEIECVDTGLDTSTGGRIKLIEDRVAGGWFHATYADGVANIDLGALAEFHGGHGDLATVTVVRPRSQFGVAELDGEGLVRGFAEETAARPLGQRRLLLLRARVFSYLDESSVLEREPLERLAADRQLHAYRHSGFWDCMDTYKDAVLLNDLWESGDPPWRVWDPVAVRS